MKANILNKMLLLAALPLAMAQCGKIAEPEPDALPSGNTVTLTLRGAETVSTPDSKTSLAGNGQVLWIEGDYVTVGTPTSLETYPVIPDPENPAVATIEGVPQSDEYVVAYPNIPEDWQYGEIGEFVTASIDAYQKYAENSFASEKNPMVGYGTSTDIELKNVASVARFGITGTQSVYYLAFAANDGSGDHASLDCRPRGDVRIRTSSGAGNRGDGNHFQHHYLYCDRRAGDDHHDGCRVQGFLRFLSCRFRL